MNKRTRTPSALIFLVGGLGDTIVALPAISAIRRAYPDHKLALLTDLQLRGPTASSLLKATGWFDQVFEYQAQLGVAQQIRHARLAWQLRNQRFDRVFALAPPRTAAQLDRDRWFFRIVARAAHYHAGVTPAAPGRGFSIQRVEPEWLRLLRIVDPNPDSSAPTGFALPIAAADQNQVAQLLGELNVTPDDILVAVGAGSARPSKQWPVDRFKALGAALLAQFPNVRLLTVGGPDEQRLGEQLSDAWGERSQNLAGRLSVGGSAALLARCAVYAGNDSGTMHLAAMVGTRCVAIFSARSAPGEWEPFGSGHIVLRENTDCAGCVLDVCVTEANKCLTRISVDTVFTAVAGCLRAQPQPAGEHRILFR